MNFRAFPGFRPVAQLRLRTQTPLLFLRSRLSQRIALSVFSSIIAIEAILSLPTLHHREATLLQQLSDQSGASLMVLAADWENRVQVQRSLSEVEASEVEASEVDASEETILGKSDRPSTLTADSTSTVFEHFRQLEALPFVAGGSLYLETSPQTLEAIGSFGEVTQLQAFQIRELKAQELKAQAEPQVQPLSRLPGLSPRQANRLNRSQRRYDSIWSASLHTTVGPQQYRFIVRHDATVVRQAMVMFMGQLAIVILLISTVVTVVTMAILQPLLIAPILALRDDLRRTASAALQEQVASVPCASRLYNQNHELGEVISAFGEMFDRISGAIVLRQTAEDKLRESELRFRTLVEQAAESMLMLDRNGTVVSINPFALRSLQYPSQRGETLSIFAIDSELTPQAYRLYWQKLQLGAPITFETTYCCQSGHTYPVEVRSSLIHEDGQEYALCFVRNINDRKQAQATQARLAEVGELAAMIVHEVRNPLATIYMALEGFHRLILPATSQLRLKLAMEEAERLKRLLNEILTYSRDQKLQSEPIDLNAFCGALLPEFQAMPAAQDRSIRLHAGPQQQWIAGDRDKLKQVFINLITNACEAISPGEAVAWTIELAASNQFLVTVQNGGEPIPPAVLPKLTQPFVSTKADGNGLGLALTKRIVEAHGGNLKITSSSDVGTTVSLRLPCAVASLESSSSARSDQVPSGPVPSDRVSPDELTSSELLLSDAASSLALSDSAIAANGRFPCWWWKCLTWSIGRDQAQPIS